jgi:hypothetical protein
MFVASSDRLGIAICTLSLCLYATTIWLFSTVPIAPAFLIFAQVFFSTLIMWMLLGLPILGILLGKEMARGPSQRPHQLIIYALRRRWQIDRFFWFWWPVLLYSMLLTLFALFKQLVLPQAPFSFDPLFYAADRAIFGVDPWTISHGRPWLTAFFGQLYYGWYAPLLLGTLACSFVVNRPETRMRYLTAFVLTWLLVGSLMAYLLPAAGPCYWDEFVGEPNPYLPLMQALRSDVALSSIYNPVFDTQNYLLDSFTHGRISLGAGISAMPSMHVALATIFACGAWTLNKAFGVVLALFAIAIWWASIHLGWHYAVDGLIAAPAALLVWVLTGKLFKLPLAGANDQFSDPALAMQVAK